MSGSQEEPPIQHPIAAVGGPGSRRWQFSIIWLIPIVTAAIGAWLAYDTLSKRGPLVTITFLSAEGLQAGQSRVRHKDVEMGVVQTVALTKDAQHVVVTVRMNGEATHLLTDKTRFWVVKPRFFAGAVSGLETLVSGSYIEMLPSPSGGTTKRDFAGLEDPPVLETDTPGSTFLLKAPRIGNMNLGSPIYYRDLTVGQVLGWDIADMADSVTIHAFIRQPYDHYVHDGSRFWNASGLSVKLGPTGLQLQLESLRALVLGGITFDTPAEAKESPVSGDGHGFPLYADAAAAEASAYTRHIQCLAYFDASVEGLAPEAAVTLHGIRIGSVDKVRLEYDFLADRVVVPVAFDIEPQRIDLMPVPAKNDIQSAMAELVRRGMRVKLESASLITGSKQLTLEYVPDAAPAEMHVVDGRFVIPVLAGGADLASSASALMTKLGSIKFEQIGDNLNRTLAGAAAFATDPQLKQSLSALQGTLASAETLMKRLNAGVDPVMQRLPAIATELEDTVKRVNRLAGSIDTGYGASSQFNRDVGRLMAQLSDAARSVRVLADLLSRHPEALIRGRTDQGP
jgi:paraquat-inducible protein B